MAAAQPAWRCVDADTSNLYVAVQSVGSALQCAGPDRLRCTFYEDNACSTVVSWSQAPAAGYMGGTSCRSNTQGWCLIGSDPKAGQPLPAGWTGGTKAAVPTPVQAPSPVVTVDPGATPAPDSGSYYIEPHGTNATTATATTTTKSYALFYATYKPTAKVVPLLNPGEGPFFTSDRITLVTLVSVLCTAVIVTIGGAYYMMKKRRAQARINAKFVPPDVGHYEADRQGTDCNTIAYDDDSFMSPDGDSEIYYDSEEDDEDMSRMSVPVSPVSPVSPAITLTRPERAALSPIKTPKPSSIVSSVPRSPLGPITPGVATPASLASPFSPECPSPSWDRSSMTSSRPSGVTSPSIVAEQMASLQMARNLHVNRLARPLGKFDKLLVSPTESTNELRELTLWLAKDLGPRTPGSPSPCDFEEYKDGEDEKESTK